LRFYDPPDTRWQAVEFGLCGKECALNARHCRALHHEVPQTSSWHPGDTSETWRVKSHGYDFEEQQHEERKMPTYTVTSANLALAADQEAAIAAAITRSHHEATGAPAFFAQIIFSGIDSGKHYIGGKPYRTPHLFVHGLIRAGRNTGIKTGLIKDIAAKVHGIAGIGPEDIWVYVQEIPAIQMLEFGRVLPEPGAEEMWRAAMTAQKLGELKATGAI
jgi:phenylpyruvate tautomerase PptA (4-oxalocrotonate tautomerase family)